MKLQALTIIAVVTGFVGMSGSNTAEANDFVKVLKTIKAIDHAVNGHHGHGPGHNHGPIVKPLPHPGHGHFHPKPHPLPHPGHGHFHPPVNQPPVKKFVMKLVNNAETKVYFSLNASEYQMLEADGLELIKSISPKGHLIKYHDGHELVQFQLDPTAVYSFEWEEDVLLLLEVKGKV